LQERHDRDGEMHRRVRTADLQHFDPIPDVVKDRQSRLLGDVILVTEVIDERPLATPARATIPAIA